MRKNRATKNLWSEYFFLGKKCFGDHGFQNMFVYQSALSLLELKEDKDTKYIIGCKSEGVYTSKLTSLHTTFYYIILHNLILMIERIIF